MRLYYGTVAPEATAYQSDLAAWSDLNVHVINVYSNGEKYYVQDAFAQVREDWGLIWGRNAQWAVLC